MKYCVFTADDAKKYSKDMHNLYKIDDCDDIVHLILENIYHYIKDAIIRENDDTCCFMFMGDLACSQYIKYIIIQKLKSNGYTVNVSIVNRCTRLEIKW